MIEHASKEIPEISTLVSVVGKGLVNARSAEYLIKHCGLSGQKELNEIVAEAWRRKIPILQYRGKYFIAKDAAELVQYISRQSDKDGNPVVEFR